MSDSHPLLFFLVGTSDTPKGNLESVSHDCRAQGGIVRGMGVVKRADKQRVWGDVNESEHKISKTALKWGHLQYLHASKKAPARHHYEKYPKPFLGNQHAGLPL